MNDAPDLSGDGKFTSILEDATSPASDSVRGILGTTFTDVDGATSPGIAVVGATGTGNGVWQYSINGGTTWRDFGSIYHGRATLLRDTDRIRFVPAKDFFGQVSLTYRAWDQTTGQTGQTVDLASWASVGGVTAFSKTLATARLTVLPVNDAPTADPKAVPIVERRLAGSFVSALVSAAKAADVDGLGAFRGLAVTGTTGNSDGRWQYTLDGRTWLDIGVVSSSRALLLAGPNTVRFVPRAGYRGTANLSFRVWDMTTGLPGLAVNLLASSATGNSTAFSSEVVTALWR